jgi:hypothetical protein
VFSCNEVNPKGEKAVLKFVKLWNQDHTQLKAFQLDRHYMKVVDYYGMEYTKPQVQQDKSELFKLFPDYKQRILNDEITIIEEAGRFLVTFTKRVNYNGIEADYKSYLTVIYINGAFRILREGVAENVEMLNIPIFPNSRKNNTAFNKNRQLFGDFNGDDLSDFASVILPEQPTISETYNEGDTLVSCKSGCNSIITFSNKDLKDIVVEDSYKSQLENLKDLNSDGADEIGFWDIKPTSKTLYIFNPINGELLTEPIFINTTIHRNLKLIDVFKKTGPNKITVTRSEQVDGKWVLKSEVIPLN